MYCNVNFVLKNNYPLRAEPCLDDRVDIIMTSLSSLLTPLISTQLLFYFFQIELSSIKGPLLSQLVTVFAPNIISENFKKAKMVGVSEKKF